MSDDRISSVLLWLADVYLAPGSFSGRCSWRSLCCVSLPGECPSLGPRPGRWLSSRSWRPLPAGRACRADGPAGGKARSSRRNFHGPIAQPAGPWFDSSELARAAGIVCRSRARVCPARFRSKPRPACRVKDPARGKYPRFPDRSCPAGRPSFWGPSRLVACSAAGWLLLGAVQAARLCRRANTAPERLTAPASRAACGTGESRSVCSSATASRIRWPSAWCGRRSSCPNPSRRPSRTRGCGSH